MIRLTGSLIALLTLSFAGANPVAVQRIDAAQSRVVVFLPSVRSFDVAESLRRLALRGRQVVVITTPESARDPKSYLLRLAHVPGVTTYLVSTSGTPFVVIDGSFALAGAGLSVQGSPVREAVSEPLNLWTSRVLAGTAVRPLDLLKLRYLPKQ